MITTLNAINAARTHLILLDMHLLLSISVGALLNHRSMLQLYP
jgi:hypothetical protein